VPRLAIALPSRSAPRRRAQDYPAKPIRLVIASAGRGHGPGRAAAAEAALAIPRPGNRRRQPPGANGVIGAELGARAAPDGYTVHLATMSAITISPAISKTGYEARDFTPARPRGRAAEHLHRAPEARVHGMQELIAFAKAKPGVLNYAPRARAARGICRASCCGTWPASTSCTCLSRRRPGDDRPPFRGRSSFSAR